MNDLKDLRPLKVKEFFRIQSPIELLGALGYYGIGAGIAYFVGTRINPTTLILGLLIGWCMQLTMSFLVSYFSLLITPANFDDEDRWGLSPAIPKQTVLIFALVSLTMSAALTILLAIIGGIPLAGWLILLVGFTLILANAVPPLSLVRNGFGEVTQAIFLVVLIPALGLVIQIGELNNLLGLITFPLFLLAISSAIALCFERYAADLTHHRKTFLTLIGWQQGVNLHTILVLLAYLVFGLVGFLGLSTRLVFAALLSLPVGLFQIWLILRIADGNKPAWRMLRFVALALPLVTAYLLLLTLWIG